MVGRGSGHKDAQGGRGMARATLNGKATRVLMMLLGLRFRPVREAFERRGMTASDVDEGWALLRALGESRPTRGAEAPVGSLRDAPWFLALDAFEDMWFPITEAVLRRYAPSLLGPVLGGLGRKGGYELIPTVSIFIKRVRELEGLGSPEGRLAREKLAQRGLRDEVLEEAEAHLKSATRYDVEAVEAFRAREAEEAKRPSSEEAEAALWGWYLEWSTVGRLALKGEPRLLRQAGLGPSASKERGGEEEG